MPKIAMLVGALIAFAVPIGAVVLMGLDSEPASTQSKKKPAGKLMYFYQTS